MLGDERAAGRQVCFVGLDGESGKCSSQAKVHVTCDMQPTASALSGTAQCGTWQPQQCHPTASLTAAQGATAGPPPTGGPRVRVQPPANPCNALAYTCRWRRSTARMVAAVLALLLRTLRPWTQSPRAATPCRSPRFVCGASLRAGTLTTRALRSKRCWARAPMA